MTSSILIPKINYYYLTIEYTISDLDKEVYGPFREGTIIDPQDYGNFIPGYIITGRVPSETFSLTEDTTIKIVEVLNLVAPIINVKENNKEYCSFTVTNNNKISCTFIGTLRGYHYLNNVDLIGDLQIKLEENETKEYEILWEKGITFDTLGLSGYLEAPGYNKSDVAEEKRVIKGLLEPIIEDVPSESTSSTYLWKVVNNNSDSMNLYNASDSLILGGIDPNSIKYYTGSWTETDNNKLYFKRISDGATSDTIEMIIVPPILLEKPIVLASSDIDNLKAKFTITNTNNVDINFIFDVLNSKKEIILSGVLYIEAAKNIEYSIPWNNIGNSTFITLQGYAQEYDAIYNCSDQTSVNIYPKKLETLTSPNLTNITVDRDKYSLDIQNLNEYPVKYYINNVLQEGEIAGTQKITYEKEWSDTEESKIIQVYFSNEDYITPWSLISSEQITRPSPEPIITIDSVANTTWAFNNIITADSASAKFAISGSCEGVTFTYLNVGYNGNISVKNYVSITTSEGVQNIIEKGLPLYKQISFTTGEDSENTNLTSWMENNGIKLYTTCDLSDLINQGGIYNITVKATATSKETSDYSNSLDYSCYDIDNTNLTHIKQSTINAVTMSEGDVTWLEFEAVEGYSLPEDSVVEESKVEGATVNKWIIKDE